MSIFFKNLVQVGANKMIQIQTPQNRQVFFKNRSLTDGIGLSKIEQLEDGVTRGRKNPLWKDFSTRLRWLREKAGINRHTLCLLSGLGSPMIAFLEGGGRPKISTVERLASALSVPACYLAFGERGERPFSFRIPRSEQPLPIGAPSAKPGDELHLGFAARLTQARELRGLSLRELSRRATLSVTAVSNYERSINLPLVDAVEQLAVALSVSPCWLAYGTGDPPSRNPPEAESTAEA